MAKSVLIDFDFNNLSKVTNLPNPSNAQDAATKAYVDSAIEGLAWKDSVRVASTANISLASPGSTIDGITMVSGDRFLAKNQTTASENGIYIWNGAATPATRSPDCSTSAELEQAVTTVEEGTSAASSYRQTSINFTLDSGSIAWAAFGASVGAASESSAGVLELATQAETDTGTDDARAITPLKLATWSNRKLKTSGTIGDGSATAFTITHNFNTRNVIVSVFKNSGNYDEVIADVTRPTVNSVTITFASAPTSSAYAYTIVA